MSSPLSHIQEGRRFSDGRLGPLLGYLTSSARSRKYILVCLLPDFHDENPLADAVMRNALWLIRMWSRYRVSCLPRVPLKLRLLGSSDGADNDGPRLTEPAIALEVDRDRM